MSNLSDRPNTTPSPALPGKPELNGGVQLVQVHDTGSSTAGDEDSIDLSELWRALRRRRKLVGITAAAVVALTAGITGYQRLFRPVYEGGGSGALHSLIPCQTTVRPWEREIHDRDTG